VQLQHVGAHHDDSAGQRRHRVQLGTQHRGHSRKQQVAHDPAADSGQHAEQRRHHRAEAVGERLLRPGDREQREARGVEQLHGIPQPVDQRVAPERHRAGDQRGGQVSPVAEGGRRDRPDQHVAHDAAGGCRRERQQEHAEEIQLALDSRARAADRKREGAHDIECENQNLAKRALNHPDSHVIHAVTLCRR